MIKASGLKYWCRFSYRLLRVERSRLGVESQNVKCSLNDSICAAIACDVSSIIGSKWE